MLLYRSKMPISVLFRLKPGPLKKPVHPLQIRLRVNGVESMYANLPVRLLRSYVVLPRDAAGRILFAVNPEHWSKTIHRRIDRTRDAVQFNTLLNQIVSELSAIYVRQDEANFTPTCRSVWQEFKDGVKPGKKPNVEKVKPGYTIIDCVSELVEQVRREVQLGDMAPKTLRNYEQTLLHLANYLKNQPTLLAESFTVGRALDFHTWLREQVPMMKTTATANIVRINKALNRLVENGDLHVNPIAGRKFPKDTVKEKVHLTRDQVVYVLNMPLNNGNKRFLYWTRLMLLTGLDVDDIQRYIANRSAYEKVTEKGRVIYIRRAKKPHGLSVIPIDGHPMKEYLIALLNQRPEQAIKLNSINKQLRKLIPQLGISFSLSTKVCRKTAATSVFLGKFSIHAVSRILGHKSIAMTEKHYSTTTDTTVLNEI